MSLDGFRTKDKYQENRHNFTSYALRQAFADAERPLQNGRSVDYSVLKSDPEKLKAFQKAVSGALVDVAEEAFPAGVMDAINACTDPKQKSESLDDMLFGLFGIGTTTVSSLVQELVKEDVASFDNLYLNGTKAAEPGLARHVAEAYKELSGDADITEFKEKIVDGSTAEVFEKHGGYKPNVLGALVKMYDHINKGKTPADARKLTKEDVLRVLQKNAQHE